MRKIEVDGVTYDWRVGISHVLIENRELKRKWTPYIEDLVPNFSRHDGPPVTPRVIQEYIEKELQK